MGEKLVLCDEAGIELLAEIISFRKDEILLKKLEVSKNINEPLKHITLYCSILKHDNFEIVTQKAVEVGVSEIVPIISLRTVKTNIRLERLEKIIKEAAEQAGRGIIPAIHGIMSFDEALSASDTNDVNIIFNVTGKEVPDKVGGSNRWGIFIGPEGGWDDIELKKATNKNFDVFSLGKLTFRAETAAIIGTYLLTK